MCAMDQMINVLIVEDEPAIAQLIKIYLLELGYQIDLFHQAEAALDALENKIYQLCILDWMLPSMQGIDFLKIIRPKFKNLKVLMLTAKSDPDSVVMGIESGADDYLTKPFDGKILKARIFNLMRRYEFEKSLQKEISNSNYINKTENILLVNNISSENIMSLGDVSIDLEKYIVKNKEQVVNLTLSEFKLLSALVLAQGQVLTREQLVHKIQGDDISVTGRTIDTHIFALRKKMSDWSKHIETIRGVGYRILISLEDSSEEMR